METIFHIDEMHKWEMTIHNLSNYKNERAHDLLVVIANAEAVRFYANQGDLTDQFEILIGEGVVFKACKNSIEYHKIDPIQIHESVEIVPSGVVEISRLQHAGYAYIKP